MRNNLKSRQKNKEGWGAVAVKILSSGDGIRRISPDISVNSCTESSTTSSVTISSLSPDDKALMRSIYEGLAPEKMWTLSTGTKMEEQMKKLALSRNY